MKKILVTGDQGYIGAVLVPMLVHKKYSVVGCDTDYFVSNKKKFSYPRLKKDIRKLEKRDLEGVDSVVHLAALSNDPMAELNSALTREINFSASVRLAELSKQTGVKRFIFSSSCSVYGNKFKASVTEEDSVNPLTSYAKTKVQTEKALLELSNENFSPIILRNPTVHGYSPNIRLDLVVNNLVACAIANRKIILLSDGRAWRPVIHVKDLSRVFMLMIESQRLLVHNQVFLVGENSQNYLIINIAQEIHGQLPECKIVFGDKKSRDRRSYKMNFYKFNTKFPKFRFKMNLQKSISELIKFFKETKLTAAELKSADYFRMKKLKYLLDSRKINKKLYWI
ncbi:MAG: SDR family oxidoreductase [Candidatus Levybacteria bacterium]|nr:SDR family oxidoreductase [Candidatus Levybacteria bacterium]